MPGDSATERIAFMNPAGVLELSDVTWLRPDGAAMRDVSLVFAPRTLNILLGEDDPGGTLLRVPGLLEIPDAGDVLLHGASTRHLAEDARSELRNRHFGFLFAQPFLLPSLSAVENVAMPLFKISGVGSDEARPRVRALLEFTGMTDHAHTSVGLLSPAEQQYVALARALANKPDILIVENIGVALDENDLPPFARLLRRAVTEHDVTILTSMPAPVMTTVADRVIEFADGRIRQDSRGAFVEGGPPA